MIVSINHREINLHSGEISYQGEVSVLEPKVLAVLNALLDAEGQLLSTEKILDTVWADVVVGPNAVQRCITQLRKHLGDDSKTLIKTFPKLGYRLQISPTTRVSRQANYLYPIAVLLMMLVLAGVLWPSEKPPYRIAQLLSDSYESGNESQSNIYNEKLVYVRHGEEQNSTQLMLRATLHGPAEVLHQAHSFVDTPAFSPDGRTLLVSEQTIYQQTKCAQLRRIDLTTQTSQALLPCQKNRFRFARWRTSREIIYGQEDNHRHITLWRHQLVPGAKAQRLRLPKEIQQVAAFSNQADQLFISGKDINNTAQLWHIRYEGIHPELVKQIALSYDPFDASQPLVLPDETLVQSIRDQLHFYPPDNAPYSLTLHGSGQLNLSAVTHTGELLLSRAAQANQIMRHIKQGEKWASTPVALGNPAHNLALFQPNGEAVAFLSVRSGKQQLWVWHDRALTQLTKGAEVLSFVWHHEGHSLYALTQDALLSVDLSGYTIPLKTDILPSILMQSDEDAQGHFLLTAHDNSVSLFRPQQSTNHTLLEGPIHWAQYTRQGNLLFATSDHPHLMQWSNGTSTPVSDIQHIHLQWRFFYHHGVLLLPDKQGVIWQYDPVTMESISLTKPNSDFQLLSDAFSAPLKVLDLTNQAPSSTLLRLKLAKSNH
ncbi:winged helix-turn-helix domain-containing protein [Pseudoalteromonas rubra]|uniref:OmpR/PhoB-type domain-containing protein n=1 Tax=Pseudoalteromonas rubra TaxID=43658 RepID=A0A5S3X112_9GAMM|nr:winged helix-turn-helix domain-containing protein [Pseudoalteromonas rubra]TMP36693.1 hypothetical protein CWB98_13800 [Pseudoalteromonas rubra]